MVQDYNGDEEGGVRDSDPQTLDPAGDTADLAESREFDLCADPGLAATVRIARVLPNDAEDSDE